MACPAKSPIAANLDSRHAEGSWRGWNNAPDQRDAAESENIGHGMGPIAEFV